MSFGQTQEERDNYRLFAQRIESAFADRMALGKLEAEITGGGAIDESDRQALLGRVNQYILDMDKADAMDREQDLIPEEGSNANAG
jgi:hypothetical protein